MSSECSPRSAFRQQVVGRTKDARPLQFWQNQFRFFPKNATDPVLNKLSVFLISRTVRNIICQRHCAIDFDGMLNQGKILLANLSTGLLTEKIAGMLGSFLVTKIVNGAFRRARLPEERRRPFYLYVDEFQNFMNLSVGFERILAEARKYNLVLAGLANQYVGQLSQPVRQAIFGNVGDVCCIPAWYRGRPHGRPRTGRLYSRGDPKLRCGTSHCSSRRGRHRLQHRDLPRTSIAAGQCLAPHARNEPQAVCRAAGGCGAAVGRLAAPRGDLEADAANADEPLDPSEDDLVT